MRLLVISHKECWAVPGSPSGFGTIGGFPFQARAISELFDRTRLVVPVSSGPSPDGTVPLTGHSLSVAPLDLPAGRGWRRKAALVAWLPRNLPRILTEVRRADAVHVPAPGDVGTIGILVALLQRKRLFVRHCGTWGHTQTAADRFLLWLLERVAGGRNVVMATGGASHPPSQRNSAVRWIFSTTLSQEELHAMPAAEPWRAGTPLKLVTVARLDRGKNVEAVVRALPLVRAHCPLAVLHVVGDGPCLDELTALAIQLDVSDSVTFHGRVDHAEVLRILASCHVFVFPTRVAEGFPKAVLEAMACGLPVVVPPVSVLPHLVRDVNGALLPGTDPASVADTVLWLVRDAPALHRMACSARATAQQYSLERWQELIGERLTAAWGPLRDEPQSERSVGEPAV